MKKILYLFIFLTIFFVGSTNVFAQMGEEGYVNVCLNGARCTCGSQDGAICSGQVDGCHSAQITDEGIGLPANTLIYILECISGWTDLNEVDQTGQQVCTTGNSTTDLELFGQDNVAWLEENLFHIQRLGNDDGDWNDITYDYGYQFKGLFYSDGSGLASNPITFTSGSFPVLEWSSFTPGGTSRKFYAFYYTNPNLVELPPEQGAGVTGDEGGQQQGTVGFSFPTTFPTPGGEATQCIEIGWDPYGRIFDSQSLEPIFQANVELQKKRSNSSFTKLNPFDPKDLPAGVLINPYKTKEDGYFSFIVPDGTYKLDIPTILNPDFTIVTDLTKIHPNYTKIYSEIYPGQTGIEIVQQGKIQHRDIPVDIKGIKIDNPPKLMESFYELNKLQKIISISGRVSHPFTKIKAYSKKTDLKSGKTNRSQLISSATADNYGRFKLNINLKNLSSNEFYGEMELEKVNLTTFKEETSQRRTFQFNPIFNYLEGYAYDETGKVLVNAKVGVYFTFSNKPYFETKADEHGYYKITSDRLPFFPYTLKYSATNGSTIKLTTTKFIDQNKQFILGQKIDLNTYRDNKGETVTKKITNSNPIKTNASQTTVVSSTTNKQNSIILIAVILLILIGGVVAIVGVYIYKKNNSSI